MSDNLMKESFDDNPEEFTRYNIDLFEHKNTKNKMC